MSGSLAVIEVDYYKYPFAVNFEAFVRSRYGISNILNFIAIRKDILSHAVDRLVQAIKNNDIVNEPSSLEVVVASHHTARLIVAKIRDRWLISRYALAEAERCYRFMINETPENLEALARILGLDLIYHRENPYRDPIALVNNIIVYNVYEFSLSFPDYVKAAKRLIGDPTWKPINLPVLNGRVYLDKKRVARVLKEVIAMYIEESITSIRISELKLPEDINKAIEEVETVLKEARKPIVKTTPRERKPLIKIPEGVVVVEAFPPCMSELYDRLQRGDHLSHHERFAIATFMLNIGASIDQVVDLFRNIPDFNEKITRYQVEHLAGLRGSQKKYRTYGCEKMKTLGLCRSECGIRSPVGAYYRILAKMAKEGKVNINKSDTNRESKD